MRTYFLLLQKNGERPKRSLATNTNTCFEYSSNNRGLNRIFTWFNGRHTTQCIRYVAITTGFWSNIGPWTTVYIECTRTKSWRSTAWCSSSYVSHSLISVFFILRFNFQTFEIRYYVECLQKKYTDYYLQPVIILVCYVIHFEISLVLNVIIKCSNIRLVLLECYILCCHLMEIESCGAERLMSLLWFVCWIHSCTRFDWSLCWPGRERYQIDYWVYCVCAFFSYNRFFL